MCGFALFAPVARFHTIGIACIVLQHCAVCTVLRRCTVCMVLHCDVTRGFARSMVSHGFAPLCDYARFHIMFGLIPLFQSARCCAALRACTAQHGTARHGTAKHAWHGMALHGMALHALFSTVLQFCTVCIICTVVHCSLTLHAFL